jgi:uncharacterized protein (TIGR02266 family)
VKERRAQSRHNVNRAFASEDDFLRDYLSDLSHSGVFIRSDDPLPVGTHINLRFTVTVDGEVETIQGEGEVVRVERGSKEVAAGMGVSFLHLTPASRAIIDRILARKH